MKKSIWIRTAVIFLMVTVTVFAAVFFYLYHASEKAITNEIIENSEQNMSFIISGIDQSLQTMTSSMNAFLSDREEIFGGKDEMSAYCRRMTDAFQSFGEFFVIEEDWVYYTKNHLYVLPSSIQKYSAMARSNRSVITEPYYSAPLAYRAIAMIRSVQNPETKAQRLFVGEMSTAKLFETYASIDMDKRTLVVLNDSGKTVYFQPMSKQIRKTAGEDGLLDILTAMTLLYYGDTAYAPEVARELERLHSEYGAQTRRDSYPGKIVMGGDVSGRDPYFRILALVMLLAGNKQYAYAPLIADIMEKTILGLDYFTGQNAYHILRPDMHVHGNFDRMLTLARAASCMPDPLFAPHLMHIYRLNRDNPTRGNVFSNHWLECELLKAAYLCGSQEAETLLTRLLESPYSVIRASAKKALNA